MTFFFASQREDISAKFGHMTLSQQSSGDLPDMSSFYMQGAPPTHSYAPPHHSYAPSHHSDSYMSPGMTLAPPTAPPPQTQQSGQVLHHHQWVMRYDVMSYCMSNYESTLVCPLRFQCTVTLFSVPVHLNSTQRAVTAHRQVHMKTGRLLRPSYASQ